MVVTFPTPGPNNMGWVIEDYDELSSDLSIFIEVETTREEEPHFDPRASIAYGPSRTIVRRSSYYGMIDEIELDGPITYHHVQHPAGIITRLVGSVGGKPWIIARLIDPRSQSPTSSTPSRSKDMTEYTDDQINEAIMLANQTGAVYAWETEMYRNVIECLPKPQDDWQECTFDDIRKGDRVKRVYTFPNGSVGASEGIAAKKEPGFAAHWRWVDQDGLILGISSDNNDPHVTFSRIPAPVVHPDPSEHPAIYVKDSHIVNFIPKIMVWYREAYVAGRQCLFPKQITDWHPVDPAKVIADE